MTPQTGPREPQSDETPDVVARAREALEGVTEGPWEQNGNNGVHTLRGECVALTDGHKLLPHGKPVRKANAEFIVAARSLVPELLAEVELLRLHLDAIPSAIQGYVSCELTGYSYHGDGSAIEALKKVDRDAEGIAAYAATRCDVQAAAAKVARLRAGVS